MLSGMPKKSSSSRSHSRVWMLKIMVREALDTSVTCTSPRVRFHTSQLSTVPKRSSPRLAFSAAPGTLRSIQRILVAEKYGSGMRPVFSLILRAISGEMLSQNSLVRRSCHTMALHTGSPVAASHTMVVSLWLVMPMAAMSLPLMSILVMASAMTEASLDQMSLGSCSTQPGRGKCWGNSFWATLRMLPSWSKTIALEELVP